MNKQTKIVLLLFVLIAVIGGILFFLLNKPKSSVTVSNPEMQLVLSHVENILKSNQKRHGANVNFVSNDYVWWITNNNISIINRNSPSVKYNFSCDPKSQLDAVITDLSLKIRQQFQKDGYTFNQLNTSKSLTDNNFYDYVEAYEKGNIKCTLVADPDCGSEKVGGPMQETLKVSCTDQLDKNIAGQEPLIKAFNLKSSEIAEITVKSGDFAYLDIHGRRAGYYMIIKKVGNSWKSLYKGQEYPNCAVVNSNKIPASIVDSCYQGDKTLKNTN